MGGYGFLLYLPVIAFVLSFSIFVSMAFAQYYSPGPLPATPAQLRECKTLGIPQDKCNELTIYSKKHCYSGQLYICGSSPPTISSNAYLEPNNNTVYLVPVGAAIAAGAAILAVKKIRILKPKHLRKARLLYFGMAIAFFGIALLAYNAAVGDDCWGAQILYSAYDPAGSEGTLFEPIFCSFWFSYRFVGVVLVLGGATIFAYSRLRYREEISV